MTINRITKAQVIEFDQERKMKFAGYRAATNALDYFQEIATQNAQYPGKGTALGLIYIAGKLAGEAGELVQQPFKAMRDDNFICVTEEKKLRDGRIYEQSIDNGRLRPERRAKIIKEAGGVLWYLAALAGELNMSLSDIALANLEQLAERTERGTLQGDGDER